MQRIKANFRNKKLFVFIMNRFLALEFKKFKPFFLGKKNLYIIIKIITSFCILF